jgi:acyl carrier protein
MNDMNPKLVEEAVLESLRRFCGAVDNVRPGQDLQNDLGIDSVEIVELAALLAGRFGVGARDMSLEDVVTVADLTNRVERNLRAAVRR